ncbi:hypothetical protein D3C84_1270510 [compost metagenome]
MLDDDTGSAIKGLDTFPGCVSIGDIVIGKFFALQLLCCNERTGGWIEVTIKSGILMRIFAVA